jgi:hypothetical protein
MQSPAVRAGCQLHFQPPYLPRSNPVTSAWSNLVALLRSAGACNTEPPHGTQLVEANTGSDARRYFRHRAMAVHKAGNGLDGSGQSNRHDPSTARIASHSPDSPP